MGNHTFIITSAEAPAKSWARDASTLALFLGLITPGYMLDIAALEWAGLSVGVVIILAKAQRISRVYKTPEEAISAIKEISNAE